MYFSYLISSHCYSCSLCMELWNGCQQPCCDPPFASGVPVWPPSFTLSVTRDTKEKREKKWPHDFLVAFFCVTHNGLSERGTTRSLLRPSWPRGGVGYSQKKWVGVCGPPPKTLTLFMTKISAFPYYVYDLTKTMIPHLCYCCCSYLACVASVKQGRGRQSANGSSF